MTEPGLQFIWQTIQYLILTVNNHALIHFFDEFLEKKKWNSNFYFYDQLIDNWINKSIEKAKLNHIRGKDLTPFLIKEINALSKNKTLEANTALIINNALLAGKISKKFNS